MWILITPGDNYGLKLKGDDVGHQRMLQEAHRLFTSIEDHGYAERLAGKLNEK